MTLRAGRERARRGSSSIRRCAKAAFFRETLRVANYALPHRTYGSTRLTTGPTVRYCVQKLPIFVTHDPLRVHFVCLVTDPSARDIPGFVREHLSLTSQLAAHTIVVLRPADVSSDDECRAAHAAAIQSCTIPSELLDAAAIHFYFDARRRIESGDLRAMSVADIQRYRACRRRAAWTLEHAYHRWAEAGYPAFKRAADLLASSLRTSRSDLEVVTLPHRYEQFGALPGVA